VYQKSVTIFSWCVINIDIADTFTENKYNVSYTWDSKEVLHLLKPVNSTKGIF